MPWSARTVQRGERDPQSSTQENVQLMQQVTLESPSDPGGSGLDSPLPPALGVGPLFRNLFGFTRHPFTFLPRCVEPYGDIALLQVGSRRIVLLNRPEYVEQV